MLDPNRFAPWVSAAAAASFQVELDAPPAPHGDVAALRVHYDAYNERHLAIARAAFPAAVDVQTMAGVRVHVVTPPGGATQAGTLLCLHGGGFMWGRGAGALLEAIPVAATTGMRVLAIEYALVPERPFPAAVEDVIAVYHHCRAETPDARIGMYGCSAGAILTAQVVARLVSDGLPVPDAIAMICGTALEVLGDSATTAAMLMDRADIDDLRLKSLPYFNPLDMADPLVMPGEHPVLLASFPPSLLITGTRDFAASSVTVMHRRLVAAGVEASLIHFDGMWHAFHMATTLPESREAFTAMARFFGMHLA